MYRELTELRRKVSQLETEKDKLTQEHHEATIKLGEHKDMHESLTYELDYNTAQGEEIKKNFKFLTDFIQQVEGINIVCDAI
jgi:chromosome segregation ATPase